MNRWPSLKQLHYLVELAECQNFNRAAKRCYVSQSTLSTGIQTLEELLMVQLVERDNKSCVMTPVGLDVVTRARKILTETRDLMDISLIHGGVTTGSIRLGVIPTIAPFVLPQLLPVCSAKYPELELLLREDTSANLVNQLAKGELDLLLLALPYDLGAFHCKPVGQDPFRLVMHQCLAQAMSGKPDYGQLPESSLFLLEQEHCLRGHALSACHMADQSKINPFSATSLYTLVQMVASRVGATFLPQMAISAGILEHTQLVALPFPESSAARDIGLVWRPSSTRVATYYCLSELISDCIASLCPQVSVDSTSVA